MKKRIGTKEMKIKVMNDLVQAMIKFFGEKEGIQDDPKAIKYYESIQGRTIDAKLFHGDCFEIGSDFWLPDFCWEEIE